MSDATPVQSAQTIGSMATELSHFTGMAVATVDYLFKCKSAHMWVQPDNAMIAFWVAALAPTVIIIRRIINNRLTKLAGDTK